MTDILDSSAPVWGTGQAMMPIGMAGRGRNLFLQVPPACCSCDTLQPVPVSWINWSCLQVETSHTGTKPSGRDVVEGPWGRYEKRGESRDDGSSGVATSKVKARHAENAETSKMFWDEVSCFAATFAAPIITFPDLCTAQASHSLFCSPPLSCSQTYLGFLTCQPRPVM